MTATHYLDYDCMKLNQSAGETDEQTMAKLINADPDEGGAIFGTYRTASIKSDYGWYKVGVMDCNCVRTEGQDFL